MVETFCGNLYDTPKGVNSPANKGLKLKTSLHGLKQSGQEWYMEASNGLQGIGLQPTMLDPSVFTTGDKGLKLGLYVDVMIILSKAPNIIEANCPVNQAILGYKDIGEVSTVLGLSIERHCKHRLITISQTLYIEGTLNHFNFREAKPARLLSSDRNMLTATLPDGPQTDQSLHQQAIGWLMWLTTSIRFDIAHAVGQLSRHTNTPTIRHWNGVL